MTADTTPPFPGWDDPAVPEEEADGPQEKHIREWAETYVPEASAKAFAKWIVADWEGYDPDGTYTVHEFLRGVLREWRGEDGGFPATPDVPRRQRT